MILRCYFNKIVITVTMHTIYIYIFFHFFFFDFIPTAIVLEEYLSVITALLAERNEAGDNR